MLHRNPYQSGIEKYGGDLAIGAFGIVNRLVFIIVMIVMGLNQGMQPIAGYNFGAGQHARVIKTLKLTIIYATCVTTFGFIVGMLFSDWVVSIFTSDAELIALSAKGLRIVVMFFPIIGFQMVTANFFQSIGMASKAIFLSLTRQMMVLLPCLIILPRFFGVGRRLVQYADFRLAGQSDSGHDAGVAAPQIQGAGIRRDCVKTKILTTGLFSATSNFHQFGSGTMGLRP